jgi:polysaccharide export outer membrane protein
VSVVRVLRASLVVTMAVVALSGCMRARLVAYAPPPPPVADSSLDAVAYGGQVPPPAVVTAAPPAAPPRAAYAAAPRGPVAYAPSPSAVMAMASYDSGYRLDAGDKLRVVVYGQDGLTNTYSVDAGGNITMPLIGAVAARGETPAQVAQAIAAKLRNGYIREPYVAAEVEQYRPFFILGEVTAPGQYPYVPNMTAESAVAIAGGYTPRARKFAFKLTRRNEAGAVTAEVPPNMPLQPGDTIVVAERWF